jgi:hypothetical protein
LLGMATIVISRTLKDLPWFRFPGKNGGRYPLQNKSME